MATGLTDYYYPGERTTDFLGHEVKKYHHTLTQILNGLLQTGFAIEVVEEAIPPERWDWFCNRSRRRSHTPRTVAGPDARGNTAANDAVGSGEKGG